MNKKYLFISLFLIILFVAGGILVYKIPSPDLNSASQNSSISDNIDSADTLGAETTVASVSAEETNTKMNNQLEIKDEVVGTGIEAVNGKSITVNYVGTLTDGTKFDSSLDRNQPFTFNLGAGEVIPGWDQGVAGMKVGGKRRLTIPPSLGYGSADLGTIPPNSTLIFEIDLLKVE